MPGLKVKLPNGAQKTQKIGNKKDYTICVVFSFDQLLEELVE